MTGDELASGLQFQLVPKVVSLFELDWLRDSAYSGWSWRHFRSSCRSGRWARHGGRRSRGASHRGPSGAAHPSDSCGIVIEIAADLESQLEIISEVPAGVTWFSPDGRLSHIPSIVWSAAWDRRCGGVRFLRRRASALELSCCKGSERHTDSEAFGSKRGCGLLLGSARDDVEATTWSALLAGWPPEVSGAAPIPTPRSSGPAMLGKRCLANVEQPNATRSSYSAWIRCRHQSHPSPCQANSRGPAEKRCASTNLSTLPKNLQIWLHF